MSRKKQPEIKHKIIDPPDAPMIGIHPCKKLFVIEVPKDSQGNPVKRNPLAISIIAHEKGKRIKALKVVFDLLLKKIIPKNNLYTDSVIINITVIRIDPINETPP